MKRQMRFHYNGSWTRWYADDDPLPECHGLEIDAVEISEQMTREEFKQQFPGHQI